jgi:hypothetical protein
MSNNNQALIDGLRMAADFFESKPEFPNLNTVYGTSYRQTIRLWLSNKTELPSVARQLGSFTKKFSDHYFELHRTFNEAFEIEVTIDREQVCKKIVTWDCPDDESLLKLVETHSEESNG